MTTTKLCFRSKISDHGEKEVTGWMDGFLFFCTGLFCSLCCKTTSRAFEVIWMAVQRTFPQLKGRIYELQTNQYSVLVVGLSVVRWQKQKNEKENHWMEYLTRTVAVLLTGVEEEEEIWLFSESFGVAVWRTFDKSPANAFFGRKSFSHVNGIFIFIHLSVDLAQGSEERADWAAAIFDKSSMFVF